MDYIPDFPRFNSLLPENSAFLNALVGKYPPYTEFNYTNLFAWHSHSYAVQFSQLNGALITGVYDPFSNDQSFTLIGDSHLDETITKLLLLDGSKPLRRVPAFVVERLRYSDSFRIVEDGDNKEYLLSVKYHAELPGPKNRTRRNQITKFTREYSRSMKVITLDLCNHETQNDIANVMNAWINIHSKDDVEVSKEGRALSRALSFANNLPIRGLGFYIDRVLCGFSIFEYVQRSTALIHFEKTDITYKGLAQFIRHSVAKQLMQDGIDYINYEQDMGIAGLRKTKSMLHPVSFLKKFTISL